MRDRRPAKDLFSTTTASLTKRFAFRRICHQFIDACSEVTRKAIRSYWFERTLLHLIYRDEVAGFSMHYDFLDTTYRSGHNGRTACHSLEIDDAKWFVNGRADEDGGVAQSEAG